MKTEQRTLRLQSLPENIHQVEKLVEDICNDYNLNHNYFGCINVALTEAFTNALVHGNKNNPEKIITISFEKKSTGLTFNVKDEGQGFVYQTIPDVKDDGKEKTFPGKGIFLIKSLSDDVNFVGNGSEIEIGFKISSIDFETAVDRIKKLRDYSKTTEKVLDN